MQKIVTDKAAEFDELFVSKHIIFQVQAQPVTIYLHHHLAEILTGNLFNNALRYTPVGGSVFVMLMQQSLVISNTAANGVLDGDKVFRRFYKSDDGSEGTGLGLAIIKEICNLASLDVDYSFSDDKHVFSIYFQKAQG